MPREKREKKLPFASVYFANDKTTHTIKRKPIEDFEIGGYVTRTFDGKQYEAEILKLHCKYHLFLRQISPLYSLLNVVRGCFMSSHLC